jgi:predicted porin
MKLAHALPLTAIISLGYTFPAFAQDSNLIPTFYGKVNVTTVHNMPDIGDSSSALESNASRIGLEGDYAFSETLKLVYQAEYQVNPNDDHFDNFSLGQRNTFIGLEGGFGSVIIGRNDSPSKLLQNGIDLYNDLYGDIRTLFLSEIRPNDLILYTSPTKSGFTASYSAIIDGQDSLQDRATKSTSASVTYQQGSFLFGIAMDNNVVNVDSFRFMSRYREGNLQLGLMYESAKTNRGDKSGVFVSASYKLDKWVLKAQGGTADQKREGGAQSTIGVDYNLDSDSRIFTFLTRTSADKRTVDNDQFGLGFEHNF